MRNSWCSPVNFDSFSTTTERAGMLMPSDSVSVANTTFSRPAVNASSTASFIGGTMPGVVRGDAGLEAGEPRVVAEHVEVGVGERLEVRVGDAPQRDAVGGVGEPDPAGEALLDGLVAAGAGEHEHDRGQHPLVGEPLDDLGAPRLVEPAAGAVRPRPGPRPSSRGATGFGPQLAVVVDERRQEVQRVGAAVADQVQVHELDRPALLDDRLGLAAHRLHPRRDLLRVRDGRRQRDDRDLGREVDDHLFPHRAAGRGPGGSAPRRARRSAGPSSVGEPRVDHVAQHLGGHHDDRRVAVDRRCRR